MAPGIDLECRDPCAEIGRKRQRILLSVVQHNRSASRATGNIGDIQAVIAGHQGDHDQLDVACDRNIRIWNRIAEITGGQVVSHVLARGVLQVQADWIEK